MKRDEATGIWLPDEEKHYLERTRHGRRFLDGYQHDRIDFAARFCRRKRRALDIGANIGLLAMRMAREFEAVECFEPEPHAFECLQRNVSGLPVRCHAKAVGDRTGPCGVPRQDASGFTRGQVDPFGGDGEMVRIDDFGFTDVDLVKIDVQGYEPFVVKGAAETLMRCKPVVVVEVEDDAKLPVKFEEDAHAAVRWLRKRGWECRRVMSVDWIMVHADHEADDPGAVA